ncbi:MAG TPA: MBL fold metallo-hydrolase [Bacteroidales bacterium]|mgnify:CR=1 FL=1|nr:MBL fold metallo-hydrolase [Bacteroidales bacterium]
MKTNRSLSLILSLLLFANASGQQNTYPDTNGRIKDINRFSGIESPVVVTIIYDNYLKVEGLGADWGYSVYIEGLDKTILFDTGTKPEIFESNFMKLGIDASKIDIMVISHEHGDHTGGIAAFVKMKTGIPVIIPHLFSQEFKSGLSEMGLLPTLIEEPAMICPHLWTSGEFDYEIAEQALVLDTKKGLVVMTGCSHPGINEMLKKIKSSFGKDIYMVFGGFHLMNKSEKEMNLIISDMKALGIEKCGATHCTGDKQIKLFKTAFGENFFELGAGYRFTIL